MKQQSEKKLRGDDEFRHSIHLPVDKIGGTERTNKVNPLISTREERERLSASEKKEIA